MKTHDVQSIEIAKPALKVFDFVADPKNLPKWTNAFAQADDQTAKLVTPDGALPIRLDTKTNQEVGTVDWRMTFPDGTVGTAFSRVTPNGDAGSIYSFTLMAPPVPLEMLEGALAEQIKILSEEIIALKEMLEA